MSKLKVFSVIIAMILTSASFAQTGAEKSIKDYGFFVKGTTGKMVMLDVTWYQEAKSDGNGGWTRSMRTMSGNELSTTIISYKKKPVDGDMYKYATMVTVFVQTLTYDNKMVPISWVDENGNPSSAPSGLENIKEANAATGIVTYATITPLNWKTAFGLNYVKFGGMKGWKKRTTRNVLPYFQSFGAMKGCVVVDDRTDTGAVYDGNSTNPTEYPTTIPNYAPHKGKLNGIRY